MKNPIPTSFALLALSALPLPGLALTTSVTDGSFSSQAGAFTVDFGVSAINNLGPVAGGLPNGTAGDTSYAYSGGALFNYDPYPSSNLANGISARPVGSTGNYWSIGITPVAQQGPGVVTFSAGVSYYGFLWGSPDAYNLVSFYDGDTLLGSFDGSVVKAPPNGDQTYARYFNVYAGAGEAITRITFGSTNNAFETDNHAFVSAVPEPEVYAMMLAGLGWMGYVARRRRQFLATT